MTQPTIPTGKKPERNIPPEQIGTLEKVDGPASDEEASGRADFFWAKCWNCGKYLARSLSPPNYQGYTCPYCGAVNEI